MFTLLVGFGIFLCTFRQHSHVCFDSFYPLSLRDTVPTLALTCFDPAAHASRRMLSPNQCDSFALVSLPPTPRTADERFVRKHGL